MKLEDILLKYVNQATEPRKIGRYWASDLYAIKYGYLTPENFLTQKIVQDKGAGMIITGEAMEEKLQKIFEFIKADAEYQKKYELKIGKDIVVVVKPDFEFKNFVIETKFPFTEIEDTIPEKWLYQCEAEYQATKKQVYVGVFTIPFNIKFLTYTPSPKRWEEIQTLLKTFDKKLRELKT
jgi:hypothetical protein